jgi:glycerol-3-phosphate O-acyltransferase
MEHNCSSNSFLSRLNAHKEQGMIPEKYLPILEEFYTSYAAAVRGTPADPESIFHHLLTLIETQVQHPYKFEPFHASIRSPIDYYQFGLDLIGPLIEYVHSSLAGLKSLDEIQSKLKNKENVIFFANHQIEADPQVISLLLKDKYPQLATDIIFVAGERVITDPLAVPASMGRNLLCIYSKRYIDHPPELKAEKQRHNQRTMELMSALLSEGGKAIYIAPSGGRDRPNEAGTFEVAPFDPQSIEMCYLMSKRAKHPTHFYPLALKTYAILPPPKGIQISLGELRHVERAPVHLSIGPCIDMQMSYSTTPVSKHDQRRLRAEYIHGLVKKDYARFP